MIVLDASALVDLLAGRPEGPAVADSLEGREICAPCHQRAEVLSAIARLQRAQALTELEAREALRELNAFRQELVLPTLKHLERSFRLREGIRVLDGLYVTLAEERGLPLVTTDARLARAEPPCEVWLKTP